MKDIPGFGGKYKISDSGEVVGPSGRILKPRRDKDGYLRLNMMHPKKGRDTYLIHRLVMLTYRGETPEGYCIDHIDGNKRNNYIGNLRFARPCQNAWNSRRRKGSSGVIGVHKNKGKFQARISVNKKRIYLGRFNSPEVAAVARDSAARLFHGEFALCNSPSG